MRNGGGVVTARGHHDLGRCLSRLGSMGVANEFHTKTVDPWPTTTAALAATISQYW